MRPLHPNSTRPRGTRRVPALFAGKQLLAGGRPFAGLLLAGALATGLAALPHQATAQSSTPQSSTPQSSTPQSSPPQSKPAAPRGTSAIPALPPDTTAADIQAAAQAVIDGEATVHDSPVPGAAAATPSGLPAAPPTPVPNGAIIPTTEITPPVDTMPVTPVPPATAPQTNLPPTAAPEGAIPPSSSAAPDAFEPGNPTQTTPAAIIRATPAPLVATPQATAPALQLPATGAPTTPAAATLPIAPSAVLAQRDAVLVHAAGSGVHFAAPATFTGPGDLPVERATTGPLPLSLDDAVSLALTRNLRLRYDTANQRMVRGDELEVTNALLPSFSLHASSSAEEINLAAMGFKASSLGALTSTLGFPAGAAFPTIIKVNVTQAMVTTSQTLFSLPDFELYRGARREFQVVNLNLADSREQVVQAVATAYLKVLADSANVANTASQEAAAKVLFEQAVARRNAGVATNLDALRAQVELQTRSQDRIAAENSLDKDVVQLDRIMGIPAGQALDLTDAAPFADLADLDHDRALATAYANRKDYLSLAGQIDVAGRELRAAKYQRLPTLAFNGSYGVLGETTGLYHGVFNAEGSLRFPIFREAAQRGEEQTIASAGEVLHDEYANLHAEIDGEIRSNLLDINASHQLVEVAQSNVELATQELADERARFASGVDDNLPVVDAQATLAGADAQLVQALYQYNVAKLGLARSIGVLEGSYRAYLGK